MTLSSSHSTLHPSIASSPHGCSTTYPSSTAELARVLRPGGRLVAVTNSERHLQEARTLAEVDMSGKLSFSRENGEVTLRRHFPVVNRIDVDGWVTFPDATAVREYVASMITESAKASLVADFAGSLRAGCRVSVFVAQKAEA